MFASSVGNDVGGAPAENESRRHRVVAYDFGIKQNILRLLVDAHCDVNIVPARTSAEDVLAMKPDGVFLSNGPGDPEPVTYAVDNIRKLLGRVPIFGICLGHQLCGLALGGRTYKLKFGHHGSNHPVKNMRTGHVEITAQNHGFVVDPDSLPASNVEITHVNLNDLYQRGHAPPLSSSLQRAVSSRSFARAARLALSFSQLYRPYERGPVKLNGGFMVATGARGFVVLSQARFDD